MPDSRSFLTRYERVPRSELPPIVIMTRLYKTRATPKGRRRGVPQKGSTGIHWWSFLDAYPEKIIII